MPKASFDYAVLRVVPRVERQEFLNIGLIVFCLQKRLLEAKIHVDEARLPTLWPMLDPGTGEAARRRGSTHLRRRRNSRANRKALAAGTLPMADRAAQHNHPDVSGAHRDSYQGRFARGQVGAAL